jgi:hypothetical protein
MHGCKAGPQQLRKPYPKEVHCGKRHMADGYAAQTPNVYLVKGTIASCLKLITLADKIFYFLADIAQVLHAAAAAS